MPGPSGPLPGSPPPTPFVPRDARTRTCPACSARLDLRAELCPACGMEQTMVRGVSRSVAVVLALVFGSVGAHRFYLERGRSGFLYLLFCWTLVPTIVGVCEGLYYLTLSERDFAIRYDPYRWVAL
ncbi:MAG: TM2 domain-containing protein [Chloroflexota bacterium]